MCYGIWLQINNLLKVLLLLAVEIQTAISYARRDSFQKLVRPSFLQDWLQTIKPHVGIYATDSECASLLFHMWYIDDGVVAGPISAVLRVLSIIGTSSQTSYQFVQM